MTDMDEDFVFAKNDYDIAYSSGQDWREAVWFSDHADNLLKLCEQLQKQLNIRDKFIVNNDLWTKFVDSL